MRVTVLGKSPSWEDAGGACSGYLVEEEGTTVLLDCGNGVFSKLRLHRDYTDVDAVLISHLHADHFLDLVPYAYALTYAPRQQPVPVAEWPGTDDLIEEAVRLEEYDPATPFRLGEFRLRFHEVPHFTTTYAIEFASANGGGRFTYGADCRPSDDLVEFARGTDLLMVEATLPRPERTGERGHMTPAEAGEH